GAASGGGTLPSSDSASADDRNALCARAETRSSSRDRESGLSRTDCRDEGQPLVRSAPVERLLLPDVDVADGEQSDEDEHFAEEEHPGVAAAGVAIDDRPRIEEGGFDVEQDEQHRDLIEADVDALAVRIEQRHAAFVRRRFRRIALMPSDDEVQREDHDADAEGDDQHDQDGEEGVCHGFSDTRGGRMLIATEAGGKGMRYGVMRYE